MPEKILIEKWKAFDGKICDTRKDCEAHEAENCHLLLCGLSEFAVRGATRLDPEFASATAAIERAALEIKRARRAAAEAVNSASPPSPDP